MPKRRSRKRNEVKELQSVAPNTQKSRSEPRIYEFGGCKGRSNTLHAHVESVEELNSLSLPVPSLTPVDTASCNMASGDKVDNPWDEERLINRMSQDLDKYHSESPTSPVDELPPNIPPERTVPDLLDNTTKEIVPVSPFPCPLNSLNRENDRLHVVMDNQRRQLVLRKGICAFMHGALRMQTRRLEQLGLRTRGKRAECAARVILHTMLLNVYRKGQDQLKLLTDENKQLNKMVENLCLQLRVVRHLQTSEKERTLEKAHEVTSLKSEVHFVKKQLSKAKTELEKLEKDCEEFQLGNEKIFEEKTKLQRELRSVEDRKEILQGSLNLERKRSEKHMTEIRCLKRTVNELQVQITELTTQTDYAHKKARAFESKNWELQLLLESRGKEFTELGQERDMLKAQCDDINEENGRLTQRNSELAAELKQNHKETLKLRKSLSATQNMVELQLGRIAQLENAVYNIQRENAEMRSEVTSHRLKNLRRRRAWSAFALMIASPFESIVNFICGGDASVTNVTRAADPNIIFK